VDISWDTFVKIVLRFWRKLCQQGICSESGKGGWKITFRFSLFVGAERKDFSMLSI